MFCPTLVLLSGFTIKNPALSGISADVKKSQKLTASFAQNFVHLFHTQYINFQNQTFIRNADSELLFYAHYTTFQSLLFFTFGLCCE